MQMLKEIRWLLHKFHEAGDGGKEKWLTKISNWKRAHPKEAKIVENQLLEVLVDRVIKREE